MDTLAPAERPAGAHTHSCGAWWTGLDVSHCGSCHLTLSSLTAFDRHQNRAGSEKLCRDPQEAGLVPVEKPRGVLWSMPGSRPAHWATGAPAPEAPMPTEAGERLNAERTLQLQRQAEAQYRGEPR